MRLWVIKDTEPIDKTIKNTRMFRYSSLFFFLKKESYKVVFFASNFNHYSKQFKKNDVHEGLTNTEDVIYLETNSYSNHVSFRRWLNQFHTAQDFKLKAQVTNIPDIILCSIPSIELAYEVAKFSIKNDIPLIIDVVDLWPDLFKDSVSKWKYLFLSPYVIFLRKRLNFIIKSCFSLTAITESYLSWAKKYNETSDNKISGVFYLGHKKVNFQAKTSGFNIIFVGSITRQFDFDKLISVSKLMSGVDINIVGDGDLLNYYKDQTIDSSRLYWHGWKNPQDLEELLNNASVAIMPYKNLPHFQKNITNKFSEYLAHGLPILTGVSGEMRDFLEHHECGEFYSTSEELVQQVMEYKTNPKKLKQHSENALRLQREHFDIDKINKDFVDFIKEVHTRYHNR